VLDGAPVGRYKSSVNRITDASEAIGRFESTPPQRVRGEPKPLLLWLEEAVGAGLPPITAAIFFAEFEAIHPVQTGTDDSDGI
jgi:hypothetical protein